MTHFSLRASSPLRSFDHPAGNLADDEDGADLQLDVRPDDRVGRPPRRSGWRKLARSVVVLAALAGTGWSAVTDGPLWSGLVWAAGALSQAAAEVARRSQPPGEPIGSGKDMAASQPLPSEPVPRPGVAVPKPNPNGPVPTSGPPEVPAASPATAPAASAPPPVDNASVAASQPYAPPAAAEPAPLAPYQKRAVAAGLHPDLSRDLLDKLSDSDWRNAADAVRKALAEHGDDTVVTWPGRAAQGRAAFTVHFVAGAGEGCRRFVVVIAKAGWETTAPPMEACAGRYVPVRG